MATSSRSARSLEQRLAALERLLDEQRRAITEQREHIARQDAALERLRSASASVPADVPQDATTPDTSGTPRPKSRASRRALLKL
ncbi:MAG TPA: hypothetical protein VGR57_06995, partial [Ktedonobacterales bacterium]|nr:hypothetical protein [Ktedonobacterales bacterium]